MINSVEELICMFMKLILTWLQCAHVKCSGCQVLPNAVITCPTIGLLQAPQIPFSLVFIPCKVWFYSMQLIST